MKRKRIAADPLLTLEREFRRADRRGYNASCRDDLPRVKGELRARRRAILAIGKTPARGYWGLGVKLRLLRWYMQFSETAMNLRLIRSALRDAERLAGRQP